MTDIEHLLSTKREKPGGEEYYQKPEARSQNSCYEAFTINRSTSIEHYNYSDFRLLIP
jgi:hypothetical protein